MQHLRYETSSFMWRIYLLITNRWVPSFPSLKMSKTRSTYIILYNTLVSRSVSQSAGRSVGQSVGRRERKGGRSWKERCVVEKAWLQKKWKMNTGLSLKCQPNKNYISDTVLLSMYDVLCCYVLCRNKAIFPSSCRNKSIHLFNTDNPDEYLSVKFDTYQ